MIMAAALGYLKFSVLNPENKTILFVNADAPKAGQIIFERLRFSDAVVSVALNFLDKPIDSFQLFLVQGLPK